MAKYSDIIAGIALGDYSTTLPTGFTHRWDSGPSQTITVNNDALAPSGKSLRVALTATGRMFLGYDSVNADPDRATVTQIMLIVPENATGGTALSFGGATHIWPLALTQINA